jgi:hypothetical protein
MYPKVISIKLNYWKQKIFKRKFNKIKQRNKIQFLNCENIISISDFSEDGNYNILIENQNEKQDLGLFKIAAHQIAFLKSNLISEKHNFNIIIHNVQTNENRNIRYKINQ